jgi:pantetheine-phosphate adenylyltransferase
MTEFRRGVYPGTFDPVTNGHNDIISRATKVVDRLIVAVAVNAGKEPLFTLDERVAMVEEAAIAIRRDSGAEIEVLPFDNLLTEFVTSVGASVIIRGLRAVSDFEYEFQMAGMNARLNPGVETVFLMASDRHQFISSRFVKEIGRMGGEVSHFVAPHVRQHMIERFARNAAAKGKKAGRKKD